MGERWSDKGLARRALFRDAQVCKLARMRGQGGANISGSGRFLQPGGYRECKSDFYLFPDQNEAHRMHAKRVWCAANHTRPVMATKRENIVYRCSVNMFLDIMFLHI